VFWTPVICNTCAKPTLLHQANLPRCTATRKVLKGFTMEYKSLMKENKSIVTDMEEIIAKLHLTMPGAQQPKESKFPLWEQGKSWELYKEEIRIFEKGTVKKPITKFQDLVAALKESKQANIAERIVTEFKVKCEEHDILTQVIKWMDSSYGQTLTEQIDEVWLQLRRFQRDKDEDIISYIERFDKLTRKCENTKVGLTDRMKATMVKSSAGLSRSQIENLNAAVDLGSDQTDLEEKMKQALRRIPVKPTDSEVYVEVYQEEYAVYEGYEGYDEAQQHADDVLYGEQRRQRFRGHGGYPPRGQRGGFQQNHPQQQGYQGYQSYQGYQGYPNHQQGYQGNPQGGDQQRGNFRGQSNFRGYNKPCDPLDTCYNILNNLTPQQQMDIISKLGQTYIPPMAAIAAPAAATSNTQAKSVFQVNNEEDEVYNVKLSAEQIYLSSQVKVSSIVIDTGSTYNLIGQQLLPVLNERLQPGGQDLTR